MEQVDFMRLGDERLIATLYELADGVEDGDVRDELYTAVDETLERLDVALLRRVRWSQLVGHPERAHEMDDWLAGVEARAALRPLARELAEGQSRAD
jgi:hypothetical protein